MPYLPHHLLSIKNPISLKIQEEYPDIKKKQKNKTELSPHHLLRAILLLAVLASAGMALPPSLGVGVYQRNSGASDGSGEDAYTDYGDYPGEDSGPLSPSVSTALPAHTATFTSSHLISKLDIEANNPRGALSATSVSSNGGSRTTVKTATRQTTLGTWPILYDRSSRAHTLLTTIPARPSEHRTFLPPNSGADSLVLSSKTEELSTPTPETHSTSGSSFLSFKTSGNRAARVTNLASSQTPASHPTLSGSGLISVPNTPPGMETTAPETKTTPNSIESTSPDSETSAPGTESSSPPTEFYLGLCWQNDILVNAAFTAHYWQAIAVLFLAVLINVLVMYALVFRAVHHQSRRWGKQSWGAKGAAKGSSTPFSTSGRSGMTNNRVALRRDNIFRFGKNSGVESPSTSSHQASYSENCWRNMLKPRRPEAGAQVRPCEKDCQTSPGDNEKSKRDKSVHGICRDNERWAKTVPDKTATLNGSKNDNGGNDEDDLTSLDDGHYNDWAAKSSISPGPPKVQVDETSFFCTVGRIKHYRSHSLDISNYLNSKKAGDYHQDPDSSVSVVNSLTKTSHISTEVETLYRRPGWLKRKLVKALTGHTGWHQRHRKVHETAVFKLARRQRAKVKMLNKERSRWADTHSEMISSDLSTGNDGMQEQSVCNHFDMDSITKEQSMCNHFDMDSITKEQRVQMESQTASDSTLKVSCKTSEAPIQVTSKQQQEGSSLKSFPFPSTGRELQSKINSLASNSVDIPPSIHLFAMEGQPVDKKAKHSYKITSTGQLFHNNGIFEQSYKRLRSLQEEKTHRICSPFASSTDATELKAFASTDFSLPNAPVPSLRYEKEKTFENHGMISKAEKFISSHNISNTIFQGRSLQRVRPQSASPITNTKPSRQTSVTRRQSESQFFLQKLRQRTLTQKIDLQEPISKGSKNSLDHNKQEKAEAKCPPRPVHQQPPTNLGNRKKGGQAISAAPVKCGHRRRYSTAQVKTAKVLLLVTAVYLVSFAPALLMTLDLMPPQRIIFYAYFVHSAANPLIYSFINQTFRKQLAALFKARRPRQLN